MTDLLGPRTHQSDRLAKVDEVFQSTAWMPNTGTLHIMQATVVANLLGPPATWLLNVGASASGKTMTAEAFCGLSYVHPVSTLTEPGLLSGSVSKDPRATGGLLRQVGDFGILVFLDFGTILGSRATRDSLFGDLREIYDGSFTRHQGGKGGQPLEWQGQVGVIALTTEGGDAIQYESGILGPRLVVHRSEEWTPEDEFLACREVDRQAGRYERNRQARREAIEEHLDGLTLPDTPPILAEPVADRLAVLAQICTRGRSMTNRDGYSRDLESPFVREMAPRVYGQLRALFISLSLIGCSDDECWRLIVRTALSGIPPGRLAVVRYLIEKKVPQKVNVIGPNIRVSRRAAWRHCEDLHAHGLLDREGEEPALWSPSQWLLDQWWAVSGTWDQRGSK